MYKKCIIQSNKLFFLREFYWPFGYNLFARKDDPLTVLLGAAQGLFLTDSVFGPKCTLSCTSCLQY